MICPHCNKEVDSYTCFNAEGVRLNLDNGCAGGVLNYTITVANVVAANPLTDYTVLNVAGCANQGVLNAHYHVI